MKFEREKAIDVKYKQWTIPGQRIDLIVEGLVIVELKAVSKLKEIHRRQILSYLKSTGLPIGLVMNFNTLLLKHGLMRVVDSIHTKPSRSSVFAALTMTS